MTDYLTFDKPGNRTENSDNFSHELYRLLGLKLYCMGYAAVALCRPDKRRRRSSGVEHSLGKGGADSSILSGGTTLFNDLVEFC